MCLGRQCGTDVDLFVKRQNICSFLRPTKHKRPAAAEHMDPQRRGLDESSEATKTQNRLQNNRKVDPLNIITPIRYNVLSSRGINPVPGTNLEVDLDMGFLWQHTYSVSHFFHWNGVLRRTKAQLSSVYKDMTTQLRELTTQQTQIGHACLFLI